MSTVTKTKPGSEIPNIKDRTDWRQVRDFLQREHMNEWKVVALDVPIASASYVKRKYGLQTRLEDIDRSTSRARRMWAKASDAITPDRLISTLSEELSKRGHHAAADIILTPELVDDIWDTYLAPLIERLAQDLK